MKTILKQQCGCGEIIAIVIELDAPPEAIKSAEKELTWAAKHNHKNIKSHAKTI